MRRSFTRPIHVVTGVADVDDVRFYKVQRLVGGARGLPTLDTIVHVLHVGELAQAIADGGVFYVMRRERAASRAALYRLALRADTCGHWTVETCGGDGAADAVALLPRFPFVREAEAPDIAGLQAVAGGDDASGTLPSETEARMVDNGWATRQGPRMRLTAIGNAVLARY